jgi:hypothetical protein
MAHDHEHMDRQEYYLEQICTIALSGALAGVAIMMYTSPNGLFFLANMFRLPVFWGGITLLALVIVRAVTLWISVGKAVPALALTHPDGHVHSHGDHHHHHDETCGHEHSHGDGEACGHEHSHHEHGATCSHEHSHGAHEHSHGAHEHSHSHGGDDHGHSHGANYWRFAVLLLPVVLYFMNLPNEGFNADYLQKLAGGVVSMGEAERANFSPDVGVKLAEGSDELPQVQLVEPDSPAAKAGIQTGDHLVSVVQVADRNGKPLEKTEPMALKAVALDKVLEQLHGEGGSQVKVEYRRGAASVAPVAVTLTRVDKVMSVDFRELQEAASWPAKRDLFGGRRIRIKGQYSPGDATNTFSLVRLKMTCCAADLQALKMVIESPSGVPAVKPLDWIAVEGLLEFRQRTDGNRRNEFVAVLKVASPEKIVPIPPEQDLYMQ